MTNESTSSTAYSTGSLEGRPFVFGEVLFDRFPDGSSVLGGAPFNVAWHLQGFGLDPLFLSRVGDDEQGRQVRQAMQAWGMDEAGLQTDSERPTGAVQVGLKEGQPSFDILPNQAYDHVDRAAVRRAVQAAPCALIYHGTLMMRSAAARDALEDLLSDAGRPVFVDVNLRDPWWREDDLSMVLDRARWAKVNDNELRLIASRVGIKEDTLESMGRRLRAAYDIDLLIVTRGGDGASGFDATDRIQTVAPESKIHIVDTVGAGDAFASVVALGLVRGWPLEIMLRNAQAFATRICGQRGATTFDPELYAQMKKDWTAPGD